MTSRNQNTQDILRETVSFHVLTLKLNRQSIPFQADAMPMRRTAPHTYYVSART